MRSTTTLWLVFLIVACLSFTSKAQVQVWNSANAVAGDLLIVAIFTDNDKEVRTPPYSANGRRSKSTKTSKSGSSKASKSISSSKGKGSGPSSGDGKGSRPSSTSQDSSKTSGDDSSSTDTKSKTGSSDFSRTNDGSSSKSSTSKSESSTSSDGSTKHDQSSDSGSTRDPSKTSESDDTATDSETTDTPSEDSEDVTTHSSDSEDVTTSSEETPSEDLDDASQPSDSEDEPAASPPTSDAAGNEGPTKVPTKAPATPTVSNDNKDNIFDTPSPSPTDTTSPPPTASPTYGPTAAPLCELNALGAYGGISDDRREYEFFYQVETTSDVTQEILTDELMRPLEREIGTRIVATLFDECRPVRRKLQELGDSCEAVGFSRLPVDRALAGVPCLPGSRVEASNTCYAIDGGVRMFFEGDCTNADSVAMAVIRNTVDDGDYSRVDPRIVNVIYLDISDIDLDQELSRSQPTASSSSTKVPGWAIILLTVVSLGLVVSLLLYLGRKKPQDKNGFDTIPDDEGDGEY